MENLRRFLKLAPITGKWESVNDDHRNWAPASYQKLDVEFPEASHFGEAPKLNFNLVYDPIHDEYSFPDEVPLEPSQLSFFLTAVFGSIVGIYSFRTVLLTPWRGTFRRLITDQIGSAPPAIHSYGRLRKAFNSTEFFNGSEIKNHSHGVSAGHRAAVNRFVTQLCTQTGLEQFSFQMSKRDQTESIKGNRTYYWAKDVNALPQYDQIDKQDFVSMIDVDYYLDMPEHLASNPQPHLIYTVQPETAGRKNEDYSYSFDTAGNMTWKVAGGASYSHAIWNYGTDWFTVSSTVFGIPYKTVVYDVQARRTSSDKQLIMLSPMRVTYGLAAIFAAWMGRPLKRLSPCSQGFAKVVVTENGVKSVSVARVGNETSCTVNTTLFESLLSTKNISPNTKLNLYQVKSAIQSEMPALNKDLYAPILTDYLNNTTLFKVEEVYVTDMPKLTQLAFSTPSPGDKPCLDAFAKPLVPTAFVPVDNKASSDQTIIGRVLLPRQQATEILGEFKMTPTKQEALTEFVRRLVPIPHLGVPMDYTAVSEKQLKPGQKKDLAEAGFWMHAVHYVKTFMKREAYGKPTDPRNITTFNPKSKIDYACFMYPLMDALKEHSFYAFGKSPLEVARRVADIANRSTKICCPDISRMDGFVNLLCRLIERAVGNRFFSLEFLDAFAAAHDLAFNNTGVTTHGMRYGQEFSRGSGEMGTSVWNTVVNLFICFYAKYLECGNFDKAWQYLLDKVLAGGDDGLLGDIDDRLLIRAARDTGFILKCPIYAHGEAGVNFLARIYGPDVWNGDPTSMCSLKRQLEKFHLTTKVDIPPAQKLYEKSLSFSFTDSNTPVIGPLVKRVLSLATNYVSTKTITRFGDDWDAAVQYPNDYGSWMDEVAREELPLVQLPEMTLWIETVSSLEDILNAPCFYEQGREFTYDEWDPYPGILILKTLDVLKVKPPVIVKPKTSKAIRFDLSKVSFGDIGTPVAEKARQGE